MAEQAKTEDIEQLREQYTSLYGKAPSAKARAPFLQNKIDEKLNEIGMSLEDFNGGTKQQENETSKVNEKGNEEKAEPVQEIKIKAPGNTFEYGGVNYPFTQGKLFAVILKGNVQYFSKLSVDQIHKDLQVRGRNSTYRDFEIPKGSPYMFQQKKRGV